MSVRKGILWTVRTSGKTVLVFGEKDNIPKPDGAKPEGLKDN